MSEIIWNKITLAKDSKIIDGSKEILSEDDLITWMKSVDNGIYTIVSEKHGSELFMKSIITSTDEVSGEEKKAESYSRYISDGTSYNWGKELKKWNLSAGSGGTGTSSAASSLKLYTYPLDSEISMSVAAGNELKLSIQYQNTNVTTGVLKVYRNKEVVSLSTINTGITTVDVTDFVRTGVNTFDFEVTDALTNTATVSYLVTGVSLSITSNYSDSTINSQDLSVVYNVVGEGDRTTLVTLDGELTEKKSTTIVNYVAGKNLSHGVHTLSIQAKTELDDKSLLYSNILNYNLIVAEEGNTETIISSKFKNNQSVSQGTNLNIDYVVYTPGSETSSVVLKIDGEVSGELDVDKSKHYWNLSNLSVGEHTLSIESNGVSKTFSTTITKLDVEFTTVEDDFLNLYLSAKSKTNSDLDKESFPNSHGEEVKTYLQNFNYTTNGWIDNSLVFNGKSYATIMYKPFKEEVSNLGLTIEIELETENDYGADKTFIDCMDSNNVGFQIKSDRAILKSSDTTVLTLFKENDKVKISFVIDPYNGTTTTYVNGVMSGIDRLSAYSKFIQNIPQSICINHDGMGGKLYSLRVYSRALTNHEILQNYLYDDTSISDKVYQYNVSDIFDGSGNVSYYKMKAKLPTMTIRCYETDESGNYFPQSKDFRPKVDISFENPFDTTKNYTAVDVEMRTQGTSTLVYPVKNYRFTLPEGTSYTMDPTETRPTRIINLKTDYMESSLSTNVGMCRMIDQMYDNPTPIHEKDGLSRTSTYGYPTCIFLNDGKTYTFWGLYNMNTDKSDPQMFGHYPGNGFPESRRFEVLFNAADHAVAYVRKPDLTDEEWFKEVAEGFEGNYPKQENGVYDKETNPEGQATLENYQPLMEMIERVSDYPNQTEETMEAYKAEINERIDFDYAARYMLTCFIIGAVDSFGKDMLVNTWGKGKKADGTPSEFLHWYMTFYDLDTCMGVDNQGKLTDNDGKVLYDYDIDLSDNVFSQAKSRLWELYAEAFKTEVEEKYAQMRQEDFTFENMWHWLYDVQINKFSKGMYNANAIKKYVEAPGAEGWLWMLNGDRINQLKRWLSNRLEFLDTKYGYNVNKKVVVARVSTNDLSKVDFTLSPDIHLWMSMQLGNSNSGYDLKRTKAGTPITLKTSYGEVPASFMELTLYSAEHIIDLGDLGSSENYTLNRLNISDATNLKEINLSKEEASSDLDEFVLGENTELASLNLKNNSALTGPLDLSKCLKLSYLDLRGTGYTSVTFPEGGVLTECHLPKTITSLTIKNQQYLTKDNFTVENGCQLDSLRIENSYGIDFIQLMMLLKENGAVRIIGIKLSSWNNGSLEIIRGISEEKKMVGISYDGKALDSPVLYGECKILKTINYDYSSLISYFPNISIEIIEGSNFFTYSEDLNERGNYDIVSYYGYSDKQVIISSMVNNKNLSNRNIYDYGFEYWKPVDGIRSGVFAGDTNVYLDDTIVEIKEGAFENLSGYIATPLETVPELWNLTGIASNQILTGEKKKWFSQDGYLLGENATGVYIARIDNYVEELALPTVINIDGEDKIPYRLLSSTLYNIGEDLTELFIPNNYSVVDNNFAKNIYNEDLVIWTNFETVPETWGENWNIGNITFYTNAPAEKKTFNFYLGDAIDSTLSAYGICSKNAKDNYSTKGIYSDKMYNNELFFTNGEVYYGTGDTVSIYLNILKVKASYEYVDWANGYRISGWDKSRCGEIIGGYINIIIAAKYNDGINGELPVSFFYDDGNTIFGNLNNSTSDGNNIKSIIFEENTQLKFEDEDYNNLGAFFANLKYCTSIFLPSSFTKIPDYFFYNTPLETFDFSNITEIGSYAFNNSKLTEISLPDSITEIGDSAFLNCPLTSITIFSDEVTIGDNLINDSVAPDNFKTAYESDKDGIYEGTTEGDWTQTMELPTAEKYFTITEEGKITDYDITGGTDIVFPLSVNGIKITSVGSFVFMTKGITSLILREGLLTIEEYAFGNNSLEYIVVPNSVTSIGTGAFYGLEEEQVTFGTGFSKYLLYSDDGTEFRGSICKNNSVSFTLPETVTKIKNYGFDCFFDLTTIVFNDNPISFGDYVFDDCDNLVNLTSMVAGNTFGKSLFKDGTTTFEDFYNDNGAGNYTLENGSWNCENPWDKEWSLDNFVYTEDDSSITITDLAKDVVDCNIPAKANGKEVKLNLETKWVSGYRSYFSKSLINLNIQSSSKITEFDITSETLKTVGELPSDVTNLKFRYCTSLKTVSEIPDSVTTCYNMFYSCTSLETAPAIPDSVISCNEMFYGCSSIINAPEIPNSVTSCSNMFDGCTSLVNAPVIPDSVTDCSNMFRECSNLVNAPVIPNLVTDCSYMFQNCSSLVNAPTIPDSVTNCSAMFRFCSALKTAPVIPDSVTDCSNMFDGCSSLKTAPEIPSSAIDCSYMFFRCTSLINASEIPDSVTNCTYMFYNCSNLVNAPVIGNSVTDCSNMFSGCTSLVNASTIGNSVADCSYMFASCSSLETAPEIPSLVTYCRGMFSYCSSLTGDIIFRTNKLKISGGAVSLFSASSLSKDVYIPYDDFSDTNSTKQAFDAAGIDGNNGVVVHDLTTYTE